MNYWIKFSIVCLVTAYLVMGYIAYALFWPVPTLVINDGGQPIPVAQPIVHPGEPLQYTLSYCKYDEDDSVVHRSLIDGQIITLTDTTGQLPLGCHTTIVRTAVIPETINPGRYYLDVVVSYKVNPFHIIRTHYRTAYFQVVAGTGAATSSAENITVVK